MLGVIFRTAIFGESHGKVIGAVVEGTPPGIRIDEQDIQRELDKRRPGSTIYVSQRTEEDKVEILSGVFNGFTTGAPISMIVRNHDMDSRPYEEFSDIPRPGHADYVARMKYKGFNDFRGGGMFSGRMTAALVMAGSLAKKIILKYGVQVYSHLVSLGPIEAPSSSIDEIRENVYKNNVRCANMEISERMTAYLKKVMDEGDSTGGVVETVLTNVPIGLGAPPMDSLEGDLAKAVFVIPAVKGIEFGAGFRLAKMKGSQSNDEYIIRDDKIAIRTNQQGGINGGISNGMNIIFRVGIKPTPSIQKPQKSVNLKTMKETDLIIKGRHDPCVAIRAVPVMEAVTAIVLADHALRWRSWS